MQKPENTREKMTYPEMGEWVLLTINSGLNWSMKRYMIDRLLRSLPSYKPITVSAKAQAVAYGLGVGDLRQYNWNEQKTKMKDPKRSIFHYEHKIPLGQIITSIMECTTVDEIVYHMKRTEIAWILKEEDKLLNKGMEGQSWRFTRPKNAYELLGIELINETHNHEN